MEECAEMFVFCVYNFIEIPKCTSLLIRETFSFESQKHYAFWDKQGWRTKRAGLKKPRQWEMRTMRLFNLFFHPLAKWKGFDWYDKW